MKQKLFLKLSLFWTVVVLLTVNGMGKVKTYMMTEDELTKQQKVASTFITPHKIWAKPYAGGRLRVLFIMYAKQGPYLNTRFRETTELWQRFDLDAEAFFCGIKGKGTFLGGELGRKRAEALLSKPYDVYVIVGTHQSKISQKLQSRILKKVSKGAGLVCFGSSWKNIMKSYKHLAKLKTLTNGLPKLNRMVPSKLMRAYQLGKGRAVWIKYNPWGLTPFEDFSWSGLALYDYRMLWVGRALLWAATKEPEVEIKFAKNTNNLSLTLPKGNSQTVALHGTIQIRRLCDGLITKLPDYKAKLTNKKSFRKTIKLPALRAGKYMIDTVAYTSTGAVAFAAKNFKIDSKFGVKKIELNNSFAEVGEKIHGKVQVYGMPPASSVLRIDFRDSYNRILAKQELDIKKGITEYKFIHVPNRFSTIWMRAQAILVVNGKEIDFQEKSFNVPKRRHGQFNFLQWGKPRHMLGYYSWMKMREAGMDIGLTANFLKVRSELPMAAADVTAAVYSTRILGKKDKKGYMKLFPPVKPMVKCWNNEPAINKYVQNIANLQKKHREHGVFCYSFGNEGAKETATGSCVHPSCLAAYRVYLYKQYKNIAALNDSWKSKYKSFSEVDLLDHKDSNEKGAFKQGLYARWYDRMAFGRVNFVRFTKRLGDTFRKMDPKAITGFEGTGGFGANYDVFVSANGFHGAYPNVGNDIARSMNPSNFLQFNWIGYHKTGVALSSATWRAIMKGANTIGFWMWMWTGAQYQGFVSPNLEFFSASADLAQEMTPVRKGLGQLLINSKMAHSGIAVLYSFPSTLANKVENGPSFKNMMKVHGIWNNFIYELGFDFDYITDDMLRKDMLISKQIKVLILPTIMSISPAQAKIICLFVKKGGQVIADVRPGIFNGHCKPQDKGSLDDLFGFRRISRGKAKSGKLVIANQPLDVLLDPGVVAVSAKADAKIENIPIFLRNKFGKGTATLLNFQLPISNAGGPTGGPNYAKLSTISKAQTDASRELIRNLLKKSSISQFATVTAPDGGALRFTEARVWNNGNARVLGILRRIPCKTFSPFPSTLIVGKPQAAHVKLDKAQNIYDLRRGRFLGKASSFETTLHAGRANFFMILPYRIGALKMTLLSKKPVPGGKIEAAIRLKIPVSSKVQHAISIELIGPDKKSVLWGKQVVLLKNGKATVKLPVAFNEAIGTWHLQATELFSGASDQVSWNIKK